MSSEGPILTDQDGNLDKPILMCQWGEHRCRHLGVHDFHYYYCAAQPSDNNIGYPWPGAGSHLFGGPCPKGCPFMEAGRHD